MIIVVTTAGHPYTHQGFDRERDGLDIRVINYMTFLQKSHENATYILADLDRLSHERLLEVSIAFRKLREAGCRILNDPARFHTRYGLLRRLWWMRINDFDAYRVEEMVAPRRFPVFIRIDGHHNKPLTDLIHTPEQLGRAVERCVAAGYPASSLLIIEYNGEPVAPGLYRRTSVFRVGDRFFSALSAHDTNWLVKYGQNGIATEALYEEEFRHLRDNPWSSFMSEIFNLAGIEYGRVDFAIVGGRPQIYEININPYVVLDPGAHPSPWRPRSAEIFRTNYLAAMQAIDTV